MNRTSGKWIVHEVTDGSYIMEMIPLGKWAVQGNASYYLQGKREMGKELCQQFESQASSPLLTRDYPRDYFIVPRVVHRSCTAFSQAFAVN